MSKPVIRSTTRAMLGAVAAGAAIVSLSVASWSASPGMDPKAVLLLEQFCADLEVISASRAAALDLAQHVAVMLLDIVQVH